MRTLIPNLLVASLLITQGLFASPAADPPPSGTYKPDPNTSNFNAGINQWIPKTVFRNGETVYILFKEIEYGRDYTAEYVLIDSLNADGSVRQEELVRVDGLPSIGGTNVTVKRLISPLQTYDYVDLSLLGDSWKGFPVDEDLVKWLKVSQNADGEYIVKALHSDTTSNFPEIDMGLDAPDLRTSATSKTPSTGTTNPGVNEPPIINPIVKLSDLRTTKTYLYRGKNSDFELSVQAAEFANLSSGTYRYRIFGKDASGDVVELDPDTEKKFKVLPALNPPPGFTKGLKSKESAGFSASELLNVHKSELPSEAGTINTNSPGFLLLINNDDDDKNGTADYVDESVPSSDDDLAYFTIKGNDAANNWKLTFPSKLRVWYTDENGNFTTLTNGSLQQGATPSGVYVEGVQASSALQDAGMVLSVDGLEDTAKITVIGVDSDVDSDNSTEPGTGVDSIAFAAHLEDLDEHKDTRYSDNEADGQLIVKPNTADLDEDGIPDYADGFDLDGIVATDDDSANEDNLKMYVLHLPLSGASFGHDDVKGMTISFTYSSSDPSKVIKTVEGEKTTYSLPEGTFRLWKKKAGRKLEQGNPGDTEYYQGDFIDSGREYRYKDLFGGSASTTLTFWIEAVAQMSREEIVVAVSLPDPGASGAYRGYTDKVEIIGPVNANLTVDMNHDGKLNQNDDSIEESENYQGTWCIKRSALLDGDFDGIPDFADFDFKFQSEDYVRNPFTLMHFDFGSEAVTFSYDAADPENLQFDEDRQVYTPPTGLRIWTKPYHTVRDPRSVVIGGDYVPPNTEISTDILPDQLYVEGLSAGSHKVDCSSEDGINKDSVKINVFFCEPEFIGYNMIEDRFEVADIKYNIDPPGRPELGMEIITASISGLTLKATLNLSFNDVASELAASETDAVQNIILSANGHEIQQIPIDYGQGDALRERNSNFEKRVQVQVDLDKATQVVFKAHAVNGLGQVGFVCSFVEIEWLPISGNQNLDEDFASFDVKLNNDGTIKSIFIPDQKLKLMPVVGEPGLFESKKNDDTLTSLWIAGINANFSSSIKEDAIAVLSQYDINMNLVRQVNGWWKALTPDADTLIHFSSARTDSISFLQNEADGKILLDLWGKTQELHPNEDASVYSNGKTGNAKISLTFDSSFDEAVSQNAILRIGTAPKQVHIDGSWRADSGGIYYLKGLSQRIPHRNDPLKGQVRPSIEVIRSDSIKSIGSHHVPAYGIRLIWEGAELDTDFESYPKLKVGSSSYDVSTNADPELP